MREVKGVCEVGSQWGAGPATTKYSLRLSLTLDDDATARCQEVVDEAEAAAAAVMDQLDAPGELIVSARCDGSLTHPSGEFSVNLDALAEKYGLEPP